MDNNTARYSHLTDDELLTEVYVNNDVTDMELELSHRLERAVDRIIELEDELENGDDPRESC
jgi:hypothetical protein